jgi:rubrerythrin
MGNINVEVLNVIEKAIELEINGRGFFEHAAETTTNKLGKKMFQKLARDEVEHLDTFSHLFTSMLGGEDWKGLVAKKEKGKSVIIEELKERVNQKGKEENASDLEAIRIGMELERKAIDFFESSAKQASDAKAAEIFKKISGEEKGHYDLLQAQYDSVTNSGHWFDIAEFRMDGKY